MSETNHPAPGKTMFDPIISQSWKVRRLLGGRLAICAALCIGIASYSNSAAAQNSNGEMTPKSPIASAMPHLNIKLEQIQRRFNLTAEQNAIPYTLDKVECGSSKSSPSCVFRVLSGRQASDRLLVVAFGKQNKEVVKITILFMNVEASDSDAFDAMLTFGTFVRLFSPEMSLESRGSLIKALIEGVTGAGEYSQTVAGVTYRTTRAADKGGVLFVIQRGET
jgi:hypothetical protein